MDENIMIRYENLPTTINAVTVLREGCYTILVNARSSFEQQQKGIEHERQHILHGDFFAGIDADVIELLRH